MFCIFGAEDGGESVRLAKTAVRAVAEGGRPRGGTTGRAQQAENKNIVGGNRGEQTLKGSGVKGR